MCGRQRSHLKRAKFKNDTATELGCRLAQVFKRKMHMKWRKWPWPVVVKALLKPLNHSVPLPHFEILKIERKKAGRRGETKGAKEWASTSPYSPPFSSSSSRSCFILLDLMMVIALHFLPHPTSFTFMRWSFEICCRISWENMIYDVLFPAHLNVGREIRLLCFNSIGSFFNILEQGGRMAVSSRVEAYLGDNVYTLVYWDFSAFLTSFHALFSFDLYKTSSSF